MDGSVTDLWEYGAVGDGVLWGARLGPEAPRLYECG